MNAIWFPGRMKVRLTLLAIVYMASSIRTGAQTNEENSTPGSPINANQVASAKARGSKSAWLEDAGHRNENGQSEHFEVNESEGSGKLRQAAHAFWRIAEAHATTQLMVSKPGAICSRLPSLTRVKWRYRI
jgi:hypothetical protein